MKKTMHLFMVLVFGSMILFGCASTTGRTAGEMVDDSVIVSEVNGKIVKDPDLHFLKINVDSYEGNVVLTGKVPSKEAEDRLIAMAQGTKGVKTVNSHLIIEPASK